MKYSLYIIYMALVTLLVASCSTTACLEEDEQLYVGLKEVTFNADASVSQKTKRKKIKQETPKGVITAVNDAAKQVAAIINGTTESSTTEQNIQNSSASDHLASPASVNPSVLSFQGRGAVRAEARAARAREEQFKAVQTEVRAVLAHEPNGALFGSSRLRSPLQIGLWTYNKYHNSTSRFGQWMLRRFGRDPILISTVVPQTRVKVATNQLHNYGFLRARTAYEILPQSNPKKAMLAYHVQTGPLFVIDSLSYEGFGTGQDSLLRSTRRQRLLKRGEAFSASNLQRERQRIEMLFREHGYYYYANTHTTFQADTINHPLFVSLRVTPSATVEPQALRPWRMGRTIITLYDNGNTQTDVSFSRRSLTYVFHGPKAPLRPLMWRNAIAHREGQLYKLSDQNRTLERLSAMGVLSQINMDYQPASNNPDCDTLNLYVTAMMDKLYESSFEVNATLRGNHQFGPGVSYELAKKNAFRAGEKVAWKIFGNYEWYIARQGGGSAMNSFELGSELSLTFPRFVFPGVRHSRLPADSKVALDVDWKNRSGYFNMLRFGVNAVYTWTKPRRWQHEFCLFDLSFDRTFSTTATFDSIVDANPALYVSVRNQFVPSVGYTATYTSTNLKHPLWLQASVKEAGHLTAGIFALCGKSWNQRDKKVFGSPFAQFTRLTFEAHKTWTLSERFKLASRTLLGAVFTYGNSSAAPYSELFYAGGASSVRGFAAHTIGPGGYRNPSRRYGYIDQTGDFKLEGNLELRAALLGNLGGAVFLDAGNVWLLHNDPLRPNSQLTLHNLRYMALGTGVGLRYDLTFLVLRVDLGIGLHAPYTTSRSGFYNIERFKDGLAVHFAIGYPF